MVTAEDIIKGAERLIRDDLYPYQKEAIQKSLEYDDVLVLASTGSGKSVCYQAFAVNDEYMADGAMIYISPLTALINDQIEDLGEKTAVKFSRDLLISSGEKIRRKLIAISPESLYLYGDALLSFMEKHALQLKMVVVDEAHIVQEWGDGFRPEYLKIGQFIRKARRLRRTKLMMLTATMNDLQRRTVSYALTGNKISPAGIVSEDENIMKNIDVSQFLRREDVCVKPIKGNLKNITDALKRLDDDKRRKIKIVFFNEKEHVNRIYSEFFITREEAERSGYEQLDEHGVPLRDKDGKLVLYPLAGHFKTELRDSIAFFNGRTAEDIKALDLFDVEESDMVGYDCAEDDGTLLAVKNGIIKDENAIIGDFCGNPSIQRFTGDDDHNSRKRVMTMLSQTKKSKYSGLTIFATKALSMGVNNPKIRTVIHAEMPGTLAEYVQEIGRVRKYEGDVPLILLMFDRDKVRRRFRLLLKSGNDDNNSLVTVRKRIAVYEYLKMWQFCERKMNGKKSYPDFRYSNSILNTDEIRADIAQAIDEIKLEEDLCLMISDLFAKEITWESYRNRLNKDISSDISKIFYNTSKPILEMRKDSRCRLRSVSNRRKSILIKTEPELSSFDYLIADAVFSLSKRENTLFTQDNICSRKNIRSVRNLLKGDVNSIEHDHYSRSNTGRKDILSMIGDSIGKMLDTKIIVISERSGRNGNTNSRKTALSTEEYPFLNFDGSGFIVTLYDPSLFPQNYVFDTVDGSKIKDILNAPGIERASARNIILANMIEYYSVIARKQSGKRKYYTVSYDQLFDGFDSLDNRTKAVIRERAECIALYMHNMSGKYSHIDRYDDIWGDVHPLNVDKIKNTLNKLAGRRAGVVIYSNAADISPVKYMISVTSDRKRCRIQACEDIDLDGPVGSYTVSGKKLSSMLKDQMILNDNGIMDVKVDIDQEKDEDGFLFPNLSVFDCIVVIAMVMAHVDPDIVYPCGSITSDRSVNVIGSMFKDLSDKRYTHLIIYNPPGRKV